MHNPVSGIMRSKTRKKLLWASKISSSDKGQQKTDLENRKSIGLGTINVGPYPSFLFLSLSSLWSSPPPHENKTKQNANNRLQWKLTAKIFSKWIYTGIIFFHSGTKVTKLSCFLANLISSLAICYFSIIFSSKT